MSTRGTLYNALVSHEAVDEFCFELSQAYENPDGSEQDKILSSMWEQLQIKRRPLTAKQIQFARDLIDKKRN